MKGLCLSVNIYPPFHLFLSSCLRWTFSPVLGNSHLGECQGYLQLPLTSWLLSPCSFSISICTSDLLPTLTPGFQSSPPFCHHGPVLWFLSFWSSYATNLGSTPSWFFTSRPCPVKWITYGSHVGGGFLVSFLRWPVVQRHPLSSRLTELFEACYVAPQGRWFVVLSPP